MGKITKKTAVAGSPSPGIRVMTATPSGGVNAYPGDVDEFPRVGDLVWGRMPGFPYWPAFVTRSPENVYRRELANGKASFHVQFFGWNDESGWVSTALEFEGLEAFQSLAAKKKSDKSMNPGRGSQYKKWEKAAREAEDTLGLTRQERVDQYLVSYAHKFYAEQPTNSKGKATPKSAAKASPAATKASSKSTPTSKSSSQASKSTPSSKSKSSSEGRQSLPAGWIAEKKEKGGKEVVVYISPEGEQFPVSDFVPTYVPSL